MFGARVHRHLQLSRQGRTAEADGRGSSHRLRGDAGLGPGSAEADRRPRRRHHGRGRRRRHPPRSFMATRLGGTHRSHRPAVRAWRLLDPMPILRRNLKVQGLYVGSTQMFEAMNRAIEVGGLKPVIDKVFPFAEAKAPTSTSRARSISARSSFHTPGSTSHHDQASSLQRRPAGRALRDSPLSPRLGNLSGTDQDGRGLSGRRPDRRDRAHRRRRHLRPRSASRWWSRTYGRAPAPSARAPSPRPSPTARRSRSATTRRTATTCSC